MEKILIIEDDIELRDELKSLLNRNGYEGIALEEFTDSYSQVINANADLILLDINLPQIDGQSLLKKIRTKSNVPIIMVTSKNTEMDEVICMTYGADDFISKPYNPAILLLHIEAVLKRNNYTKQELVYGNMQVDSDRGVIILNGKATELSKNEMKILIYLLKNKGRIVSRDELISYLWDNEEFVDDNTLTVNINRVRKKLEENGLEDVILTKRGQGYLIRWNWVHF